MFTEKNKLSKGEKERILLTGNIILILIFVVLLFSFWSMQILKNRYYTTLAEKNITRDIEVKAPRGLILDRNNTRLSENKLNFNLFLVREYSENLGKSFDFAASITGKDKEKIIESVAKYNHYPEYFMIPLKRDLPLEEVIYIESRSDELPEFKIEIEPGRAYPNKEMAAHVLGYISELTAGELEEKKTKGYKPGDIVGRNGIEQQYEAHLKGARGIRTVARDNLGRVREILSDTKPVIGSTVILTLDFKLQEFVENLFKDHKGAVGIADLKTGGILAMVSTPNFNPEFFSGVLDRGEWLSLVNDPDKPLHNKFLQGLYSPGSVFKIVMALAALQEKVIGTSYVSHCSGAVKIYNRYFHCWTSGHGAMNITNALKNSCNVFFYRLGKNLDIDIIAKYAGMLGLGDETFIDLPNEKKGLVPTKAWKLKTLKERWFPGETISVAIGGGMLNITPVQALLMISTVALRGKMPGLHLLDRIENNGKIIKEVKPVFKEVPIDKENFEIVIEGLHRVVNKGGTGRAARVPGLDVCGKTGTQQIISKENPDYKKLVKQKKFMPHAWFVSFAPRDKPEIAVVVFVENGGDAGAIAAPISAKIYKKMFL